MSTSLPSALLYLRYEDAAQAYLRSLPLEHFMEATPQATQREITLESLALVKARRSDVHVFNELLVQYPLPRNRIGQVVPDNMVVVWPEPIRAETSFNTPLQPTGPFWVLEYVSKSNRRKDYEDNVRKYEKHLKVPYYLIFVPDVQELTLFRMRRKRYVSVRENARGRCEVGELELEVALLDGWVRFWYRGDLLPLPGELLRALDDTERRLRDASRRAEREAQARMAAEEEVARLRAELERVRKGKRNHS